MCYEKNRTNKPELRRKSRYGVTPERYAEMYEEQNGLCALGCGRPIACIDHSHATEQVRQLLCKQCNCALGLMNDDPSLFERAAQYLRRYL